MSYYFRLSCFFISMLFSTHVIGQENYITSLSTELAVQEKTVSNTLWVEDVDLRTMYTATFHADEGLIKIVNSTVPIHYIVKGKLEKIDPIPVRTTNGYAAMSQPNPTYLTDEGQIGISAGDFGVLLFGGEAKFNGIKIDNSFKQNGVVFLTEEINGIKKEVVFRENGAKYNYHLFESNAGLTSYKFTEEIRLAEGLEIVHDEQNGVSNDQGWKGKLLIKNKSGETLTTIHEALYFDQNKNVEVGAYNFWKEDDYWVLELNLSESWINDPNRSFPVIVDPLVTGPTGFWTGGNIPSCLLPQYSQDSFLVTIPPNITVTELNVTGSYYADPFAGAVMGEGSMRFSTDCANSQTFTVTGANANTAGTAYLEDFNLLNPMMCCFPESCALQTFWLSYHLGRSVSGTTCNVNYIRYDATTSWPLQATVVGHTAEHASAGWNISNAPICSDKCDITGTVYVQYGVAPYTITHPWSSDTLVVGSNSGCGSGYTVQQIAMQIPSCPVYCDTINTSLSVPPPVVYDACGNLVTAAANETVTLKPTPSPNPVYDTIVCSGVDFAIELNQCIPDAITSWSGNGTNGWSTSISHNIQNSSNNVDTTTYLVYSVFDGCDSDTMSLPIIVYPNPSADYQVDQNPIIVGVPAIFSDQSLFPVSPGVYWEYEFGDGTNDPSANSEHLYPVPGFYPFCFHVMDANGCIDSLCEILTVVPAEIMIPNVITADGDGVNDNLTFNYLEFYGNNHLSITNRWGNILYETDNYQNNWTPDENQSEGVYFFRLDIIDTGEIYSGFFHIVR